MRIDALALAALADELSRQVGGARVDPIIAPTPHSVAMQCYAARQNRWLLISAHPQNARVCLVPARPAKLVAEPSTFIMLLRKHIESGHIAAVRWVAWERIIECDIIAHGQTSTLIAEIMGNLANILLVSEQRMILGVLRPVSQAVNHYRALLPGHPYVAPPPQTRMLDGASVSRIVPDAATGDDLAAAASAMDSDTSAVRVLMAHVAGMSQSLARETLCRAEIDPQTTVAPGDRITWVGIAAALNAIAADVAHGLWQPTAWLDTEGRVVDGTVLAPACEDPRPQRVMPGVSDLVSAIFDAREWGDALTSARAEARRTLKSAGERLTKKLATLRAELAALDEADRLRVDGELLLAFAGEIAPGATTYTPPDLGMGEAPRPIALDPRLTAIENANARFARYHKMRRAAAQIPAQIQRAEVELAQVAQWQTDLDLAESVKEIALVREGMRAARVEREGPERAIKKSPGKSKPGTKGKGGEKARVGGQPLSLTSSDGFKVYVGKNSQQNEYVTFGVASGGDLWFHARGVPGAHVVVKSGGRPVPRATIDEAAQLAAWFSQSRGATSVPVDYTEQRYVRHMLHGGPGQVVYSRETTLHAVPRLAQ